MTDAERLEANSIALSLALTAVLHCMPQAAPLLRAEIEALEDAALPTTMTDEQIAHMRALLERFEAAATRSGCG